MLIPPRVFLSHSSQDKAVVRRIANDLVEKGIQVWFDDWEIRVGDSLSARIESGIEESGFLVVALTNASVASPWVSKEITAGMTLELERREVVVLPLLLEDCKVPLFLRDKLYADFRASYESGLAQLLAALRKTVPSVINASWVMIQNNAELIRTPSDIQNFFKLEVVLPREFALFRKSQNFRLAVDRVVQHELDDEDWWSDSLAIIGSLQRLDEQYDLGIKMMLQQLKRREQQTEDDIWDMTRGP